MKKVIMAAIAVASLCLSNAASAADVVITTGQQGLTYNAVYGVNLASALSEYGYSSTVIPSKGSLDNLDKVASGTAQIGFTQADAFQFWRSRHSNEAQKVDIIGELADECVFVAVKKGGNRQELHEKLRVHSQAAARVVKEEGGKNDLIDRICADPAFMITREEVEAILRPEQFTGRSCEQVEEYLRDVIRPLLAENADLLGEKQELSV